MFRTRPAEGSRRPVEVHQMKKSRAQLLDELKGHIKAAEDAAAPAVEQDRNLTAGERTVINRHVAAGKAVKSQILELDGTQAVRDELAILSGSGGPNMAGKAMRRGDGSWSKSMTTFLGALGAKALVPSGSITVPSLSAGIIASEDRPRTVLALIPFVPLEGTDMFSFLRETVRTHAASTVAKGKLKPTSTYSIAKVEDRVRTIAHLSEPIDRADLADVELLEQYLEGALRDGVILELEDQVINGAGSTTGVLDDLDGILATSGIQAQPWVTDRFTTARKAVTALEDTNIDTSGAAWVMSPAEWESYELSKDDEHYVMAEPGTGGARTPIDRARRTLWGYKVITSAALADGSTILGDWSGSCAIRERQGVQVDWSDAVPAEDGTVGFQRNQISFRAEGRWGLAVTRPAAFVEVDLTAGS
jgi:HK97 family phage major capsid protein